MSDEDARESAQNLLNCAKTLQDQIIPVSNAAV